MRKFKYALLIVAFTFIAFTSRAQLTLDPVNLGPYAPGSSISTTFNPGENCILIGNKFNLYLIAPNGTELPGPIGSYDGFYSTFVNGVIPAGTPAGTGYKLRIRTTAPISASNDSSPFSIGTGSAVVAKISSFPTLDATNEIFGYCPGKDQIEFDFKNESTPNSIVSGTIRNELTKTAAGTLAFTSATSSFTASLAHYTVFITANLNGVIGTRAYAVVNNNIFNSFSTSGNNVVCLPGGYLEYGVDVTSPDRSIQNNYPGNTYQIKWGDGGGTPEIYTLCDLKVGYVRHMYNSSSCGNPPYSTGGETRYNVFGINIGVVSPFCGATGGPISTYVKVVTKPENSFNAPAAACTGSAVTFTNTSIAGQDPSSNNPQCTDNAVTYNWYVNNVKILSNVPKSTNFVHAFTTPQVYTIKLESITSGTCNGTPVIHQICIQNPPKPAFNFGNSPTTGCAPFSIQAKDQSVIDNNCNAANTYNWIVSPSAGVTFTNGIAEPVFHFANPGIYTIILEISTASCGTVRTPIPQTVILIDGTPTATLSKDANLCGLGTYNFTNTPNSLTYTNFTGTQLDLPDTYTWTVTESDGTALASGDYSFAPGNDNHTKYPSITFNKYKTYKVSVVHKNSCGAAPTSQLITFSPSPKPTISVDPICYDAAANLTGTITNGSYISVVWSALPGGGTFTNVNTLTTTYFPSQAERDKGSATVTLTVNTGLEGDCKFVPVSKQIIIYPNNTGANATQTICTGQATNYTPKSSVDGSTYNWTATNPDGNASGFNLQGAGPINETLTNTNATANAVVIYKIIPKANLCDGIPFTFTVTITPKPVLTVVADHNSICSNQPAAIKLTSNLPTTTYTWTSTATGGITGNTNVITPVQVTSIQDILVNSGTSAGTVTYTITPFSAAGCEGVPFTLTLNVDPALTVANAGPDENICNITTFTLKGNQPQVGSGKWTLTSGQNTVVFNDATKPDAVITGLSSGETYVFKWTISNPGACTENSDDVKITVNTPTNPGVTTGTATVCYGSNGGSINLNGNVGLVLRWENSVDNGATWVPLNNLAATQPYSNLILTTQFRAVVQNGGCTIEYSTPTTITVSPATTIAKAGTDQILCASKTVLLEGNQPATGESGLWTKVSGTGNIEIVDPTSPKTQVTGLSNPETYVFKWTITGNSPCGPSESTVIIRNNKGINQNISSSNAVVCNGQTVAIDGSLPTGGNEGNYQYVWEQKQGTGAWTVIAGETGQNISIQLTFTGDVGFRRTVTSGGCTSVSNELTVTVLPPIKGNTISTNQTICSGKTPEILTGSIPEGADGQFLYQWQSSPDGNNWTNISSAIAQNYPPQSLTTTTFYRRLVGTVQCSGTLQNISNIIKVTVNPNATAEFNWTADKGCIPFKLDIHAVPYADRNNTYTWYADDVQIATGINFPEYILKTSNTSVTIKLVVSSLLGCSEATFSHVFSTNQAVPASFTPVTTTGCDPLKVTFVNTSILTAGATFKWDFGNGESSVQANPGPVTFYAAPSGKDSLYTVTLTATTTCGSNSVTATVFVKAKPIAVFSPSKTDGCSPMSVDFTNTSPGGTNTYYYDFGDGSPVVEKTDKSPVNHVYNTTKTQLFTATLTAVNDCGTDIKSYDIRVAPQNITPELVVDAKEKQGCAPWTVHFDNNSIGASRFEFDFGDGGTRNTITAGTETYTFTKPGTYTVKMTAYNSCSVISTTETITVLPQPQAAFDADMTLGCAGLTVQFRNNTQDGFSYSWDFGDGSPLSNEITPLHTYNGDQEYYTVTLTATNSLGCTQSISKNQYIHIVPPPVAKFNVSPSTKISIPDYTFRFEDESTNNPSIWHWDFGDKQSSALQNPSHTYADTGKYTVTLKVFNQQGCTTSTFKQVIIEGVPGYLYLPNAFMPGGSRPELRTFQAKGSGIKSWRMAIFNKWGQAIWETTKLEEGRPVDGWDGTFSGSPAPQGVYFWKVDVEFINGTEWKGMSYDNSTPKRTGPVHLIR